MAARSLALVFLLSLAAAAPSASAQSGAPLVAGPTPEAGAPLVLGAPLAPSPPAPSDSGAPLGGVAPTAPSFAPPSFAPVEPQQAPSASNLPAPVEMGDMQQLDVWAAGVLTAADGGLPETLWTGADAAVLAELFDRLPATIDSPAARTLARRALASGGRQPAGAAVAEAGRKRVSALARIGFADDVAALAVTASGAFAEPNIAQFAAQSELARNRRGEACVRIRAATEGAPPPFILRMRAYCAAAQGDSAMADLALEVARSANANDAWFGAAIGALIARPARPPAARYDNSLNASVSLAAELRPGPNPLGPSSTLALLTVARSPNAPTPALRAQAAAIAFRRGVLPLAEARETIRAGIPAPPAIATGLIAAVRDVEAQPGSLAAAGAINTVLRGSSAYGDFAAAARLFQEDIARLTQAPDPPATLLLARAAAAAGDSPLAARLAYSAQQANADPVGVARVRAAIALDDPGALSERLAAGGPSVGRDAAILGEYQALNAEGRAFLASHPPTGGARADLALLGALQAAANNRIVGETALLASLIAAPGAHTLDAESLTALIRALKTVGLDDAARSFATEALVGPAPAT